MEFFAGCALLGLAAGFFAGLLGVGGGLIIVPVLSWLLEVQGLTQNAMHYALGTSLASILFTSVSSLRAHHARGAVEWNTVRRITPGILFGTFVGAALAARLSALPLKIFFVAFLFYAAVQMWWNFKPTPHRQLPGMAGMFGAGSVIGAVSSWVGIGGGTLSVPFQLWCKVPLHRAIGTSAAIGLPIAAAGAAGYAMNGPAEGGVSGTLGYIHLTALACIALGSVATAPLGARAAHALPVGRLKRIFALLLLTMAIRMTWSLL
ncbi:MAG: sulfite exporter TauE/SafE family protein [Pseudomonadota bacterium]